ncbi:hypothetical protein [Fluviicola taffensis]|uniref:Lipoprotein n=1 Tax=Fluviicola taffensis (strain DSM 16823 / NCIMB 13979 / RW262) TaxID=755732 RepID=F2IEL2_FLUTR|nr:hypothetical protein [Fluviicola taffensis]AEA44551.1 hypothetical protein Fluta_2567 [Fluviicola taffensis DSM 16823]
MFKQITILGLFLCGTLATFSCENQPAKLQEPISGIPKKEQELIQINQKIMELRSEFSDSLPYYSELFSSKLQELLSDGKTLTYSFKSLTEENSCNVNTSKDGLFRIYSWDSQLGGTMRFFNVIYQYRTGNNIKIQLYRSNTEDDPAWFCSDIFTVKAKKNTFYLAITNGIYSTKDMKQSIKAFELTNQGINDRVLLMKTDEGLQNSLDVYYDFFSVVDRPERPVSVIRYDSKKKIISVSTTNEKDEITNNYITYSFNGNYFEQK